MDHVEIARRTAAGLHAAAVAAGHDPWDAYAFAVAIAEAQGYAVEDTAPGGAILRGTRATIIPDDVLIVHERAGTRFEQALLVAHEVGHLALGDAPTDAAVTRQMNPARSSEMASPGFDRIVDYGRRQRREVQVDLFARELVLPRTVVRKLHVDEGMTAAAVATRLGAPYNVVAQQFLDALLLPAVEAVPEPVAPPSLPNPEQEAAARHQGAPFLLEAGPGTGKTQTLIARVAHLLREGVDPRRILVLTFSNKAAGEVVERIERHDPEAAKAMWVGTFHAFGLDVVRVFHAALGIEREPGMLDRVEAAELLEREFPRLDLRHYRNLYDPTQVIADMLAAFSRAKDEVADPDRYAACVEAMAAAAGSDQAKAEAAQKAAEVAIVYRAYENLKSEAGSVDFGDLVMLPVLLFRDRPDVAATVRARYDHVLVDEYQDVNRASVLLVEQLVAGGAELWAVGDVKQSIYRFRGASPHNMARFGREDFPGGCRGRLERNYRSVAEVVACFSRFAGTMAGVTGDAGLAPARAPSGTRPELVTFRTGGLQSAAIAAELRRFHEAGHSWRDQAVLCTGNDRLGEIARDLEAAGIPVLFLGSVFERPEVKDLLSLLSILVDPWASGLVRVGRMAGFEVPMPDVMAVLDHHRSRSGVVPPPLDAPVAGLSADGAAALGRIANLLDGFDEEARPWDVAAAVLLDRSRLAAQVASSDDVAGRAKGIAIWQFMTFLAIQPVEAGLPIRRLLDRVRRLVRLAEDRDLRHMPDAAQGLDAVRLMTIHGAKGLEFPIVHLPGLNSDTLPRPAQPPRCPPPDGMVQGTEEDGVAAARRAHVQEQECLFYVAMSRARDRLLMYAATEKANGHARPRSPYVGRLGSDVAVRPVAPPGPTLRAGVGMAIAMDVDGPLRFSATQVGLYDSCPRRFLYTHVLKIGGHRAETPFTLMHLAVSEVVRGMVAGAIAADEADAAIAEACRAAGLGEDTRLADYEALASGLVAFFIATRAGLRPEPPIQIQVVIDGHEVSFRPDDVVIDANGTRRLRRVRTGHARSGDVKDAGAAALTLAAAQAYPGATIQIVHLGDRTITPIAPGGRDGGRAKIAAILAGIAAGDFPTKASTRTCPGCPAFFVCGPVPAGPLRKRF